MRLLEPLVVDCGWCAASNRRDQTADCVRCGGPLPAIPGGQPGPRPPDVPRKLVKEYEDRIKIWKNVEVLIGAIFTLCFFWTIIFPIIGIILWKKGADRAARQLAALQHGTPTRGRLLSVQIDTTQAINNQHPWRIDYEFDTYNSGVQRGTCSAWDKISDRRKPGDVLWVVYSETNPSQNAIWPPIR